MDFNNLGKGRICRIEFESEVPVKAVYKKQGIRVIKCIKTSVRCGVSYSHLPNVIAKRSEEGYKASERTNNFEWVIPNVLTHNTNTNKDYLYVAPMKKNSRTSVIYKIIEDGIVKEASYFNKDYAIDSYWTKKEVPDIMTIAINNIKKINGKEINEK